MLTIILLLLLLISVCCNVYAFCIALPDRYKQVERLREIISSLTITAFEFAEQSRNAVARCNEVIKQFEKNGNSKKGDC